MLDTDKVEYLVVRGGEEQYSILDHIDLVWTDIRPLSVRRRMDGK